MAVNDLLIFVFVRNNSRLMEADEFRLIYYFLEFELCVLFANCPTCVMCSTCLLYLVLNTADIDSCSLVFCSALMTIFVVSGYCD